MDNKYCEIGLLRKGIRYINYIIESNIHKILIFGGISMRQEKRVEKVNLLLFILRILIALLSVCLFVPALNPANISGMMNDNLSFFTAGTVYDTTMSVFKRALTKNWVDQKALSILFTSSVISCLGIIICSLSACLTLGELKFKKLSTIIISIGAVLGLLGLVGIMIAYKELTYSNNLEKIDPVFSKGIIFFLILIILCGLLSFMIHILLPKPLKTDKYAMQPKFFLFLVVLPFIALCLVFSYLPLWGWRYGFYDYKPGLGLSKDNFVGLKWFTFLFENSATRRDIASVMKNTLAMSGLGLATSWVSMAFAIFLSEIKAVRFRRIVQTFTTIPNFISWVLVYAFAFALFETDGLINKLLIDFGVIDSGVNFLLSSSHIWLKMLAWGMWKGLGWGAIIYLAAITGIDQQLYEAATVDGAGRFRRMWHITVPGLLPTYFVLLMLSIAGILNNGMEQYFVFKNSANIDSIRVLDLYVYLLGLQSGSSNIALATVVGMMKSLISVTLLFLANGLSKLIRKESII